MLVKKLGDFLGAKDSATIACLYTGKVVRILTKRPDGNIILDPTEGESLVLSSDTDLIFEPWVMDRGSILFRCPQFGETLLKLCGEEDTLSFPDGTKHAIRVHPDIKTKDS